MSNSISIPVERGTLEGALTIPADASGIVIFAHGSGSSRHSPRNQFVAEQLQSAGLGTLLMDLLTPAEESVDLHTREHRFDIPLLASRVSRTTDWLLSRPEYRNHQPDKKIGYFGASTGAAAALVAAADRQDIAAVVSRGGRPDLAGNSLPRVQAPTLLIVGGGDDVVIGLNQDALGAMRCEKRLEIVAGASHLFEERGTLEQAARLARDWFVRWMNGAGRKVA